MGKVADLNGDSLADVYSVQNNATSANVLTASISRGDGTFTTVSTNLPVEPSNSFIAVTGGPAFADFHHSGHLDAAVALLRSEWAFGARAPEPKDGPGTRARK